MMTNVFSNDSYLYPQNQHAIHIMYNHSMHHPSTPPAPAHNHFTQLPRQLTQPWQGHSSSQWSQATPELYHQLSRIRQEHEREI
jgi:hypothetical protein